MGTTYSRLIQELCSLRVAPYRSDPERREAQIDGLLDIVQAMLEKLRDADNELPGQHP